MYQDTYIEYWGEIFVSARIIEFGITFERFLKDPWKHLMSCGQESAPDAIAVTNAVKLTHLHQLKIDPPEAT
mgnify:FL=1